MTEYQKILLDILLEIDRVCRKNNIEYALAYGSALGQVNYGGFIPWDGDADVIMTKDNWIKFIDACKTDLNDAYILDCFENDVMYDIFIPMKVKKKNTWVKEGFMSEHFASHTKNRGIYVDIQIICGVEEDHKKYLNTQKKFWLKQGINILLKHFPRKRYKQKIQQLEDGYIQAHKDSSKWNQRPTTGTAYLTERFVKDSFPKDYIFPFRPCVFEGHELFIVNKPKEFCLLRYGTDCLQPEKYPEEKKVSSIKEYKIYD